ncbi:uncharacterized protein LOC126326599 [Schistocerca gregaria]|uniref:uncharacterized protein LOC126326599 n=1 Tax=Schistocerca gregaria TaxID=7010 RepID=UPI00211E8945|nr:uncharacterized protein LOC126326599 [Schistocerca gregaria]
MPGSLDSRARLVERTTGINHGDRMNHGGLRMSADAFGGGAGSPGDKSHDSPDSATEEGDTEGKHLKGSFDQRKRRKSLSQTTSDSKGGWDPSANFSEEKDTTDPEEPSYCEELSVEDGSRGGGSGSESAKLTFENWKIKSRQIVPIAISMVAATISRTITGIVLYAFVGRLDLNSSSAAGLANMYVNVTGYSVCTGLLGGLDTLCPQAMGIKNYRQVGVLLYRSVAIVLLFSILIATLWFSTLPLLLLLRQDPTVSRLASHFVYIQIPGLVFYVGVEALKKYLQHQRIVKPTLILITSVNALCILLGYVLILHTPLKFYGHPISLLFSNIIGFLALAAYILYYKVYELTYAPFSFSEVFRKDGVIEYLRLSLPGAGMICAEWIGFEIHVIMSGWISVTATTAQYILMNTNLCNYSISVGITAGVDTIVGGELSMRKHRQAQLTTKIGMINATIIACIMSVIFLSVHKVWGRVFNTNETVIELVKSIMPIMVLFLCSDSIFAVCSGVLFAAGKQKIGFFLNLFAYYVVGALLGAYLAFSWGLNLQLKGLWIGLACGSFTATTSYLLILIFSNWEKWSQEAYQRSVSKQLVPTTHE